MDIDYMKHLEWACRCHTLGSTIELCDACEVLLHYQERLKENEPEQWSDYLLEIGEIDDDEL